MRIVDGRTAEHVRFPLPASSEALTDASILYVVEKSRLSSLSINSKDTTNILCVGKPTKTMLASLNCNVLWLDIDESEYAIVMEQCAELFSSYNRMHIKISECISKGKPLDYVASFCSQMLGKPLYIWGLEQACFLFPADTHSARIPSGYENASFSKLLLEKSLGPHGPGCFTFENHATASDAVLSDVLLCHNLYIKEKAVAVLIIEDAGGNSTERDKAVLSFIASLLQCFIKRDSLNSLVAPSALAKQIELLLGGEITSWQLLEDTIKGFGWDLLDEYVCFIAQPVNPFRTNAGLIAKAAKASSCLEHVICLYWEESVVFVANLSKLDVDLSTAVAMLTEEYEKRPREFVFGVSIPFSELQDLCYYRRQAEKAIEFGSLFDPCEAVHHFEDYFLDFVAQCCLESMSATALFPSGFNRLKNYEYHHGKDSSLTDFFHQFIDNDFHIKPTVSAGYFLRTTAFNKLKRLKQLSHMDLESLDTKIALKIASRAIKISKTSAGSGRMDQRRTTRDPHKTP